MVSKTLSSLLILACVVVLPIVAQTPAPPGTANQTMGTNPTATTTTTKVTKKKTVVKAETKTEEKHETKTEEKHETKAEEKAEHKTVVKKTTTHHASHAYEYATRLAALLQDTQGKATLNADTWKKIANEANALANKLYASTSGKWRTDAKEARTHVREMHAAAMKGDADGAKAHAGMALPYVYKIIEATAPKK